MTKINITTPFEGKKLRAGISGATGMVGREAARILSGHPWIEVVSVSASKRSAGKTFREAISEKVKEKNFNDISDDILNLTVQNTIKDMKEIASQVDFIFCALDLPTKEAIVKLEEDYAKQEVVVVSNNSACRWLQDVPMLVSEINGITHTRVLPTQRKRLGTEYGCIVVKPNCAAQSYMALLDAIKECEPYDIVVSLYQAFSGSGKYLEDKEDGKDIRGTIVPLKGEAEKSENEPKKIFGKLLSGLIVPNSSLSIDATSYRVPVQDGHIANLTFKTRKEVKEQTIINLLNKYNPLEAYQLPSSPSPTINYLGNRTYPNPRLHVDNQGGMEFTCGALKYNDKSKNFSITGLTHNIVRGAAGGAIQAAELLIAENIIRSKS
jgi:aspartate-semialdehyde dehydrogenase